MKQYTKNQGKYFNLSHNYLISIKFMLQFYLENLSMRGVGLARWIQKSVVRSSWCGSDLLDLAPSRLKLARFGETTTPQARWRVAGFGDEEDQYTNGVDRSHYFLLLLQKRNFFVAISLLKCCTTNLLFRFSSSCCIRVFLLQQLLLFVIGDFLTAPPLHRRPGCCSVLLPSTTLLCCNRAQTNLTLYDRSRNVFWVAPLTLRPFTQPSLNRAMPSWPVKPSCTWLS